MSTNATNQTAQPTEVVPNPSGAASFGMERRDFLATVVGVLTISGNAAGKDDPRPAQPANNIDPDLREKLIGNAIGYRLDRDIEDNRKALWALSYIYALSANPGSTPEQRAKAISEIEDTVNREKQLTPELFGRVPGLFAQPKGTVLSDASIEGISLGISSAGQLAGAFGLLSPGASLAIGLGGTFAEPALRRLNQPADLTPFLPPRASPQHFQMLNAWAIQGAQIVYKKDETFRTLASSQPLRWLYGVELDPSLSKLVSSTSPPLRAYLRDINFPEKPRRDEIQEAVKRLEKRIKGQTRKLDHVIGSVRDFEKLRNDDILRRNKISELSREAGELTGFTSAASFVATHLFGSPELGRNIAKMGSSAAQVYQAVGLYRLGQIGAWGLAGAIAGAATLILSTGDDGFKFQQAVLSSLDQIHVKLDELLKATIRIEKRQEEILRQLSLVINELREQRAETRLALTEIERKVATIASDQNLNARQADVVEFGRLIDTCKTLLVTELAQRPPTWKSDLTTHLLGFHSYAIRVSKKAAFSGDPTRITSFAELRTQAGERAILEMMFGHLPAAGALIGANEIVKAAGEKLESAGNPSIWAIGTEAYLEGRALSMDVRIQREEEILQSLWKVGSRMRLLAMVSSTPAAVKAATNAFLKNAGAADNPVEDKVKGADTVLGMVYRAAAEYEQKLYGSSKDYTIAEAAVGSFTPHMYAIGPFPQRRNAPAISKYFNVDNDPLNRARDLGLIEFKEIDAAAKRFQLVAKYGPDTGKAIRDGRGLVEYDYPALGRLPAHRRRILDKMEHPKELLDYCQTLVHSYELEQVKKNLSSAIAGKFPVTDLSAFEGAGVALRMVMNLVCRRFHDVPPSEHDSRLDRVDGLFTKQAIADHVDRVVTSAAVGRRNNAMILVGSVYEQMQADCRRFITLAEDAPEANSLPLVDEMLRRLSGFMDMQGVPLRSTR